MTKKTPAKTLRITQVRSPIGLNKEFRKTLAALGIKRMQHTVEQPNNPAIRGMIHKINFLLSVEEVA